MKTACMTMMLSAVLSAPAMFLPVYAASDGDEIGQWLEQMKNINYAVLGQTELEEKSKQLDEAWRNLVAAGQPAAHQIRIELDADADDAYFQLSAAMVLYQIERSAADADVIEALERTSIDDNASQYFYLCHRIARRRNPDILPVLARLLGNRRRVVYIDEYNELLDPQIIATYLFGVYGLDSLDTLKEAAADEDAIVRANAAALMGYFGDDSALFVLADLLAEDTVEQVRAAAANALGQMDHPAAVAPLEAALLSDRNVNVRAAAAYALGELQLNSCIDPLSLALNDISPQVRQIAAASLQHIAHERCAARIINRLEVENDPNVRLAMISALGSIGHAAANDTLASLAESDNAQEAAAATESLRRIEVFGPPAREAYPGLPGEELGPAQLQNLLKTLIESHGEGIEEYAKTIFLSAQPNDLPALEELRRSILMVVNNETIDRLSEAGKLMRLIKRKQLGLM